jgi:hypothetical protein
MNDNLPMTELEKVTASLNSLLLCSHQGVELRAALGWVRLIENLAREEGRHLAGVNLDTVVSRERKEATDRERKRIQAGAVRSYVSQGDQMFWVSGTVLAPELP